MDMSKMTKNGMGELLIRGIISTLPAEDQAKVTECHDKIMEIWTLYGEDIGTIAFTLASTQILNNEKE